MRHTIALVLLALVVPTVAAGGSSWLILGKVSYGETSSIGYASNSDQFVSGAFDVGDHMAFRGLYLPSGVSGPTASGDVLTFGDVRPGGAHIRLWDGDTGAYEIECAPADERTYAVPCRIDFPEDHTLVLTPHGERLTVVDVMMPGADGTIIPCVRVLVQGEMGIDPTDALSILFEGSLRGHMV